MNVSSMPAIAVRLVMVGGVVVLAVFPTGSGVPVSSGSPEVR